MPKHQDQNLRQKADGTDRKPLTFRLQISVDEPHEVQVLQRRCHLGRVESGLIFQKALPGSRLEGPEEFPAHAVFHAEVEVLV